MGKGMEKKAGEKKRLVDQVLLTPEQVAAKTGWKLGSIAGRRCRRQGPPWIKVGALVRYPEDDLNKWLEQGQQEVA